MKNPPSFDRYLDKQIDAHMRDDDEPETAYCPRCDFKTPPCTNGVDCSDCFEPYEKPECFEDEDITSYRKTGRER